MDVYKFLIAYKKFISNIFFFKQIEVLVFGIKYFIYIYFHYLFISLNYYVTLFDILSSHAN